MSKVYMPSYCSSVNNTMQEKVLGVYETEKRAIYALIELLVDKSHIESNFKVVLYEDEDGEQDIWELSNYELKDKLQSCIDDFDTLVKYCERFNDGVYLDSWKINLYIKPSN